VRVKAGPWLWVLSLAWLVTVTVKWTRLAASMVQIARVKSRAVPMNSFPGKRWSVWCHDAHRGPRVGLGWSDKIQIPCVFGMVRPAILFPRRLQGVLSESELEQVALHELAHVARYDDWWQILQRVIEDALFFHPAVKFVSHRLALEREIACDDWVMHRLRSPREYAYCLTRLAEHRARPWPVPGAVRSRKHIIRRIEMLLNSNRNTRPGLSRTATALAALGMALVVVQVGFVQPIVAVTSAPDPAPPVHHGAQAARTTHAELYAQSTPPRPPEATPAPPTTPAPPAPPAPPITRKSWSSSRSDDGTSMTIHQDGDEIMWSWSDGPHKVRVELDGRVEFSGDGMSIKSMSSDGYFVLRERTLGKTRELEIVPGRTDSLEYYYSENDKPLPYGDEARRWLAELLPEMMRETGLGARERVAAIRADQGVKGVQREISAIPSDYVKRIYFEALLSGEPLRPDELQAIFLQAGRELESDYELAELLILYADYTGGEAATVDAFVQAVQSIDSDYEVRRVLTALGTQEELTDTYAQAVLELAGGMESDYEKAELLLDLAEYSRDHAPLRDLYLDAVAGMESDYEKRRVLQELLEPDLSDTVFVSKVLGIAETIGSDYERAELLVNLADPASEYDASMSSYIHAVEGIESDYEARRALSALTWHDGLSEQVSLDLLRVVSGLDSDYEKAEFLLEHAEHFASTEAVRNAFDRAVDSIDSDYERERVEAASYRHSRKAGSGGNAH
jgi:hypothetical protein